MTDRTAHERHPRKRDPLSFPRCTLAAVNKILYCRSNESVTPTPQHSQRSQNRRPQPHRWRLQDLQPLFPSPFETGFPPLRRSFLRPILRLRSKIVSNCDVENSVESLRGMTMCSPCRTRLVMLDNSLTEEWNWIQKGFGSWASERGSFHTSQSNAIAQLSRSRFVELSPPAKTRCAGNFGRGCEY